MENQFKAAAEGILAKRFGKDVDENNFVRLLKTHDWHYMRSDDHSVFVAGKRSHDLLMGAAVKLQTEFPELVKKFLLTRPITSSLE